MRKAFGAVLVGVGVFALALAVLLPTVVVSKSKKTPLDLNITQVSSGPAKVLDAATNQLKDVQLRATRIVRTDSTASDATNTTVDESLCIVIVQGPTSNCLPASDPRLLSYTTDVVTANRKSAESVHVPAYKENVNGDTSVRHTGLSYKWPIDAKKRTYQFYDPDVLKAFPATYEGTSKVAGLTVYKYVSETGDLKYKVQGLFDGTYNDVRTVWVEPKTGAIINGTEHQVQKLANGTVALDTTLSFEKSAINFQAKYSKDKIDQLKQAQIYAPIGAAVIGIGALIGAFFLLRRRDDADTGGRHSGNGAGELGPDDGEPGPDDGEPGPGSYDEPSVPSGSSQT